MSTETKTTCGLTGWWGGFHLGVSHWTQPDAATNEGRAFRTLTKIGEIGPLHSSATWNIELGLSELFHDADVRLFSNGYEIQASNGSTLFGYIPAPGVFLLTGPSDIDAQLFCAEHDVTTDDSGNHWLELSDERIHLLVKNHESGRRTICLQVTDLDKQSAINMAESYLEIDLVAELNQEYERRLPFFNKLPEETNGPLTILAFETLISHLQPPAPAISGGRWITNALDGDPTLAANHLLAAVEAWNLVDLKISKELIRAILSTQGNNGGIHAQRDPENAETEFLAMWPILAQACRLIWDASEHQPDQAFFSEILPKVEEHVQFALEYYAIESSSYHGWQQAEEALVPEIFDDNVVSVTLTTLLLSEIEELSFFAQVLPDFRPESALASTEREQLLNNLQEAWNEKAHIYTDFYINGEPVKRISLGSYFPLRRTGVDPALSSEMEKQLKSTQSLLGSDGMMLWQHWDTDEIEPRVEALQQLFVPGLLNRTTLVDQQGAFMQGISHAQNTWYKSGAGLTAELKLERNEFGDLLPQERRGFAQDLGAACLHLVTRVSAQEMDVNISDYPWIIRWLERRRTSVTAIAILLLFATVAIAAYGFSKAKKIGWREEYARQGLARNSYKIGRYDEAIAMYTELVKISEKATVKGDYQFMLANAYYQTKDYENAEIYYRRSMENSGANVPQPQWNLTQTLYRLDKLDEAKANLENWLEKFAEHYPNLEARAKTVNDIIDTQINRRAERPSG